MDFVVIKERSAKNGVLEIYPEFRVRRSSDLMVRGKSFYAIWDDQRGLWSTDEYDVQRLVDEELARAVDAARSRVECIVVGKWMRDFSSGSWNQFKKYVTLLSDNYHQLDQKVTYLSQPVKKSDYVSKRLPYDLEEGEPVAYEELIGTLYSDDERRKFEWAIGSVLTGESSDIQKFIVFYGDPGGGKSTVLNIIGRIFDGYTTSFDAKSLTSSNNQFATETLKNGPLVAIQHDGDLSRIEDNAKLNSIVSHEEMTVNEKYKSSYTARFNCFLFLASNKPVRITDAKSGIIRRLIDVRPSGSRMAPNHYFSLVDQVSFELGKIAKRCINEYSRLGRNYYAKYKPLDMMLKTDTFFNFVEANYFLFSEQDGISLKQAYDIYKQYCDEALVEFKLPRHKFREELKNYFKTFEEVTRIDDKQIRSYYSGFDKSKFSSDDAQKGVNADNQKSQSWLVFDRTESRLDREYPDCPAQYANGEGTPSYSWENCRTTLSQLTTSKLHYVRLPKNHIVIDFDLKNEKGEKDLALNMVAASSWPATYAELSKSGTGIHLHYTSSIDPEKIGVLVREDVEVKRFVGRASLRRKVTKCNDLPIAQLNSGLPLKGEKMVNFEGVKSELGIRRLIEKNLRKEIHGYTKPSVDFIYDILEEAYNKGIVYDVTDLRPAIIAFANSSSHQGEYCLKKALQMKFCSEKESPGSSDYSDEPLVFFDCEVFPNLFLINWKYAGKDKSVVRMINPTPQEVEELMRKKLIGFNCRRYDNHILYARYTGYSNEQLFDLSRRIINGSRNAFIREAYNLSYADIYEFASKRQSLKKWEIELGIHHQELGLPWDQPVPEEKWVEVAEYCDNDVLATEAVFDDRVEDWEALQVLSKLSGLSLNDSIRNHAAKIIFGDDKHPQDKFVYTDLSEEFPGYSFENGKSTYLGEEPGEGGYVYAEPGMYNNVALLDIASMHPTSIKCLNLFGPFTDRFYNLVLGRLAVKHQRFDEALDLLGASVKEYLTEEKAPKLAYAFKIIINKVYGFTSASFDNPFRDPRNIDNIVAKRGALFMINLKREVQKRGFTVAHIKTDSIKIPNATEEIIAFVMEYGESYGYTFEHEATYDRMCLVNDAVYIAKYKGGKFDGEWTATGAQFAHPLVFKTLFSKEKPEFRDYCEAKTVTSGTMYLDMNEKLPEGEHDYHFVGRAGLFCPIVEGKGGGILYREKDGKYYSVTGTKGYRWLESEAVITLEKQTDIDLSYAADVILDAIETIGQFGDAEWFMGDDVVPKEEKHPWLMPCGDFRPDGCLGCPYCYQDPYHTDCERGYEISHVIFNSKGE